eukprot:8992736-Pyramimonas_sp.AAC.2
MCGQDAASCFHVRTIRDAHLVGRTGGLGLRGPPPAGGALGARKPPIAGNLHGVNGKRDTGAVSKSHSERNWSKGNRQV